MPVYVPTDVLAEVRCNHVLVLVYSVGLADQT